MEPKGQYRGRHTFQEGGGRWRGQDVFREGGGRWRDPANFQEGGGRWLNPKWGPRGSMSNPGWTPGGGERTPTPLPLPAPPAARGGSPPNQGSPIPPILRGGLTGSWEDPNYNRVPPGGFPWWDGGSFGDLLGADVASRFMGSRVPPSIVQAPSPGGMYGDPAFMQGLLQRLFGSGQGVF